jgi:hypothetical protein
VDFEQVLKEVLWRLVTEGSISYRRIKLTFGLDDNGLKELRRELIGIKRLAADVDGSSGRLMGARPDRSPGRCLNHRRPCGKPRDRRHRPWSLRRRMPSAAS